MCTSVVDSIIESNKAFFPFPYGISIYCQWPGHFLREAYDARRTLQSLVGF